MFFLPVVEHDQALVLFDLISLYLSPAVEHMPKSLNVQLIST